MYINNSRWKCKIVVKRWFNTINQGRGRGRGKNNIVSCIYLADVVNSSEYKIRFIQHFFY